MLSGDWVQGLRCAVWVGLRCADSGLSAGVKVQSGDWLRCAVWGPYRAKVCSLGTIQN